MNRICRKMIHHKEIEEEVAYDNTGRFERFDERFRPLIINQKVSFKNPCNE